MRTVLITGTTSGIGYALSELFAKKECHVILVSRNAMKLSAQKQKLENGNNRIDTITCDLEQTNAAEIIYKSIKQNGWQVDILVNNAGFNEAGLFSETDATCEQGMINLHINFVTDMMKLFIPEMIQNSHGHILNVGSTGSYIACPKDAVYAASKAYILHLSKAVHAELKGTGVTVTTLCPGSTRTEFAHKAKIEHTLLFKIFVMSPHKVALSGLRAMEKGKPVIIPGLYNKILVLCSRLLPYSFIGWMTKKML
ncbi:SDR family oxidoreductase [Listeria monocytogenes]|nr:SDR family oxidoreductase [Listeria monocytogenes]EAF5966128.1 SDR family oxidoreductase [Listeria monocytogenes]EBH4248535.1 SDR family oxidoreductase [Listeria monocytogenes]EBH4269438.1 SDR family oxidoreductase [Listeria monocytogenes]ECB9786407.1 SDR family oxidoreductase [Listeria monocytogenes]